MTNLLVVTGTPPALSLLHRSLCWHLVPSCIQALSWPHADPFQQYSPDDQEDGQEQWKQPPQTVISSSSSVGPQLWAQSPLEEGCGLAPRVGLTLLCVLDLPCRPSLLLLRG